MLLVGVVMRTVRNYNIDGPLKRRRTGSDLDLSYDGDRPIVRSTEMPSEAGNVGGKTVKSFLDNYFFKDDPAFFQAVINISTPIASPTGNGTTPIIINTYCYIESGNFYNIGIHITITPNDETNITLRRVLDSSNDEVYTFEVNDATYPIANYHDQNESWRGKMRVGNNNYPYDQSTGLVHVITMPAILWGKSNLQSVSGSYPYDNNFQKEFKKINAGTTLSINWETESGYQYFLVPESFPALSNILVNGVSYKGSWNNLIPLGTVILTDTMSDIAKNNSFVVYRTVNAMSSTIGNPINYEFKF